MIRMERRNIEYRTRNVELRSEGLKVQDILCHFWFAAEKLGEVVN